MARVNLDENEKNANWLHGRRVTKVMGKIKEEGAVTQSLRSLQRKWHLGEKERKKIRLMLGKNGGGVDEDGVISGTDVFTYMIEEILELGGLVYYEQERQGMIIANWRNPTVE